MGRALKNKGNTPKYGLIFHSTFIGRAGAKNKGRISRYLANKCSIASRIDCFTDHPNTVFGEKLRDQVENRLKFYESNGDETPLKNSDVMKEAIQESNALIVKQDEEAKANADDTGVTPKKKKKKKKSKADESTVEEPEAEATAEITPVTPKSEKKKKKKKAEVESEPQTNGGAENGEETKKKKKKKRALEENGTPAVTPKKKKVAAA